MHPTLQTSKDAVASACSGDFAAELLCGHTAQRGCDPELDLDSGTAEPGLSLRAMPGIVNAGEL